MAFYDEKGGLNSIGPESFGVDTSFSLDKFFSLSKRLDRSIKDSIGLLRSKISLLVDKGF